VFIVVTGLGGSGSRAAIKELLNYRGVHSEFLNKALDFSGSLQTKLFQKMVGHFKSQNYDPLQAKRELPDVFNDILKDLRKSYKDNDCGRRTCAFKEEMLMHILPIYRYFIVGTLHQRLFVLHYVRDPLTWTFHRNWIAVLRISKALTGVSLPKNLKHVFTTTKQNEGFEAAKYTLDPQWLVLKARFWNHVEKEVQAWAKQEEGPMVSTFVWRNKIDPISVVVEELVSLANMEPAPSDGRAVAASYPLVKNQSDSIGGPRYDYQLVRFITPLEYLGGKGNSTDVDFKGLRKVIPKILEVTQEMASKYGFDSGDATLALKQLGLN